MTLNEKKAFDEILSAIEGSAHTYLKLCQDMQAAVSKLRESVNRAAEVLKEDTKNGERTRV